MGGLELSPSDGGDPSVAGHDNDGGRGLLQSAIQERKAFDVQHMHLINEEHAGNHLGLALLAPLQHFVVDLLPHFMFNFPRVPSEQRQKPLRPGIDDIDFMQRDGVHDFFAFLQLPLGALHEPRIGAHRIKVLRPREGAAQFGDLATGLINGNDVPSSDFVFGQGLDHLLPQIVHRLHFGGLQNHAAGLSRGRIIGVCCWALDLDLHDFALHNFRLFFNADTDRPAECLSQGLGLAHLQRKDLTAREHCERHVVAQGLCASHGDGSLTCSRGPCQQHGTPCNRPVPDHLHHDSRRTACGKLPHHPLAALLGLKHIVQAQATDVRVRSDSVDSGYIFRFRHEGGFTRHFFQLKYIPKKK
mmetsp:Transcript_63497/g.104886  ORF Transcript_63497/g.104886 Transcript_63497/m.104886 type:complete len:358 (+) Transcript_63497:961-2034(+)